MKRRSENRKSQEGGCREGEWWGLGGWWSFVFFGSKGIRKVQGVWEVGFQVEESVVCVVSVEVFVMWSWLWVGQGVVLFGFFFLEEVRKKVYVC